MNEPKIIRWTTSRAVPIQTPPNIYANASEWEALFKAKEEKPVWVWDGYGWRSMGKATEDSAMAYLNDFSRIEWDGKVYE